MTNYKAIAILSSIKRKSWKNPTKRKDKGLLQERDKEMEWNRTEMFIVYKAIEWLTLLIII